VVEYTYDAWGAPLSTTGSLAATLGAANPFRYRSYYWDSETGLYYLMSRYYNPEWGRFVNADEPSLLLFANDYLVGTNLFAYCANNPVMFCDPSGMGAIALRKRDWLAFLGFGIFAIAISPAVFAVAGLMVVGGTIVSSTQLGFNELQKHIDMKATLKDTASKYPQYRCKEAAKAMEQKLKNKNLKYGIAIYKINTPHARYDGLIYSESKKIQVSNQGYHIGIIFDDKVYCNIHPGGLSQGNWVRDLYTSTPATLYVYSNTTVAKAMAALGIK